MASAAPAGTEPMVTIKVLYDGTTRRGKSPLRDMVPPVLEQHLRAFLQIPAERECLIERYSDSAAAYVLLDTSNVSVYKQLYRAAKAKSKLKFRVTLKTEDKITPQPATVEDEPETATLVDTSDDSKSSVKNEEPSQPAAQQEAPEAPAVPQSLTPTDSAPQITGSPEKWTAAGWTNPYEPCEAPAPNPPITAVVTPNVPCPPACITGGATFAVCCNSCERTMPDAHYHCSTCDDGDFDLCQPCVDRGVSCYSNEHWLIKRTIVNGQIVYSTTETIAPKQKVALYKKKMDSLKPKPVAAPAPAPPAPSTLPAQRWTVPVSVRTCNSCIRELPERDFLHCENCEDFDLCQRCFSLGKHGHHPRHRFAAAVSDVKLPDYLKVKMLPGRNQLHHAICDGCDKYVTGVRHKCLDCPDWDYCSGCFESASFVHPNHRFVPIYEPLADVRTSTTSQPVHVGICCDGPLCSSGKGYPTYIRGTRYKCAVCHDLDFCANCEASPANEHNKTHPLIKFRTAVRHVSVTTMGEHADGKRMPAMGDRLKPEEGIPIKRETSESPSINPIQTVVDVKPVEIPSHIKSEVKEEVKEEKIPEVVQDESVEKTDAVAPVQAKPLDEDTLSAVFIRDSVADGTILPPNHVFEQTWVLRNDGEVAWPAGCSVKFVGGDYMGHVDSAHPAGISELVSASESTISYTPLAVGQEFSFTVLLRTPARPGKIASYWRLTTPEGCKFGDRLWCDVQVRSIKPVEEPKKEEPKAEEALKASNLMFPKLEKESPVSSIHQDAAPVAAEKPSVEREDFEDCAEDADWDGSDDGFMTDEEYDILDASDEEYLEEQQKKLLKK